MKSNRELLSDLGIDLKRVTTSGKTLCPKCSHDRKKKTDPCLSVDIVTGAYNCHNCDWKGYVMDRQDYEKVVYAVPTFNNRTNLPKSIVDWFFKRGISQQTLIDFKVTYGKEWMPQTNKEEVVIQFNYFRAGELVNIKFRDTAKNFKLVKNAELILYNLDSIADQTEIVICEGEIDAMAWHEAGIKNVVSVPNGASKSQKLEYLDNCYPYFQNATKIYLSTDNDEPGINLREELARRFGKERCFKVDFSDFKDANEYFLAKGKESLRSLLIESKEYPIDGVFTIDDVWDQVEHIYQFGLPEGDRTGDPYFDAHLRCMPGELTMVTGIPGHGKSIYLDQVTLGLCLNSGWEFGVFSPESYPMPLYFTRLAKRLLGKKFSKNHINPSELQAIRNWIRTRYNLIFPSEEGFSLDVILEKAKQLVLRKGIKGLIIDPWNRIESTIPNGYNEGKFINEQLAKIINFNQKTGIHTFLVAHPTKMKKRVDDIANYEVPNMYSISGSAHFFNMTQNGFTVYRNYTTQKTEVHFQKVKWEHLGKIGMSEYTYHEDNARFYRDEEDPNKSWLPTNGKQELLEERLESAIQPSKFFSQQELDELPF